MVGYISKLVLSIHNILESDNKTATVRSVKCRAADILNACDFNYKFISSNTRILFCFLYRKFSLNTIQRRLPAWTVLNSGQLLIHPVSRWFPLSDLIITAPKIKFIVDIYLDIHCQMNL